MVSTAAMRTMPAPSKALETKDWHVNLPWTTIRGRRAPFQTSTPSNVRRVPASSSTTPHILCETNYRISPLSMQHITYCLPWLWERIPHGATLGFFEDRNSCVDARPVSQLNWADSTQRSDFYEQKLGSLCEHGQKKAGHALYLPRSRAGHGL